LVLPVLPPGLRAIVDQPDFSFADALRFHRYPRELNAWVGTIHFAFRDLERRLEMADVGSVFARSY
jgi:hypothetical protein